MSYGNFRRVLYSIQFLHQITTFSVITNLIGKLYSIQFLHQITTSRVSTSSVPLLYSIQFLHQITTRMTYNDFRRMLYSIQFLHQITTTSIVHFSDHVCCIVSNFYIKSQRRHPYYYHYLVV